MNTNKEVEWRRFILPKKVEQINFLAGKKLNKLISLREIQSAASLFLPVR